MFVKIGYIQETTERRAKTSWIKSIAGSQEINQNAK